MTDVTEERVEITAHTQVERQIELLQSELDTLRAEVSHLRRRDDTIKFMMQKIDDELRLAARLQRDFMPRDFPEIGRVRFHSLFRPAGYVSGDLYDITRLDEHHVGFYMADAVGHGMPAALLTMFVKHALITKEITPGKGYRLLTPGQTLTRLNDQLVEQELSQATFATAIYGIINVHTGLMQFATAGHPAPIVLKPDGTLTHLSGDGGLLGIFPSETFVDFTLQLHPGDRVIINTDGVEVAFATGDQFDITRWHGELSSAHRLPSPDLIANFARVLDQQEGSMHPKDDLTLLLVDFI